MNEVHEVNRDSGEEAGPGTVRIMLVDDHSSFREPLAFMLGRETGFEVVAQADSVARAREALSDDRLAVEVVLVDLDLPDGSGVELIGYLRETRPEADPLVLSAFSDRSRLVRAIEAGACGVLHKSASIAEIVEAVRRLISGETLLSQQEVVEALWTVSRERAEDQEARNMIDRLTPRELEVLQAIAQGWSDKMIADRLYLGIGTVRSHVTSILQKLGVHSRLQALLFAARYELVELG